jgi:purine-cytosine permease-like protein
MFNFLINPGSLLTGGLAVAAGLPFVAAVGAQVIGTAVALVAYVVMATIGVDYGIPGQVATRAVYGLCGARAIPSLLRTVASIYWFAFQTLAGASVIVAMLAKITGTTYPLIGVALVFGIIQACVAVVGFNSLKVLSRVALPIKLLVMAYLFVLFAGHDDPNFGVAAVLSYPSTIGWHWVLFAGWVNVTIASWFTSIADAADFARYSRSRNDMWVATFTAGTLGMLLSTALGGIRSSRYAGQGYKPVRACGGSGK